MQATNTHNTTQASFAAATLTANILFFCPVLSKRTSHKRPYAHTLSTRIYNFRHLHVSTLCYNVVTLLCIQYETLKLIKTIQNTILCNFKQFYVSTINQQKHENIRSAYARVGTKL